MYSKPFLIFLFLFCCFKPALPQSGIDVINTDTAPAATSSYTATAPSDSRPSIVSNREYVVNYGQDVNLTIASYEVDMVTYDRFVTPDTLIIQRTDNSRRLNVFYSYSTVEASGPPFNIDIDAEQQVNEDALYQSGLMSVGYDNLLVNDAFTSANVERVDVIYYNGILTSEPSTAVFPVLDRGGNDEFGVAAITGLDANGLPSSYGTLVSVVDADFDGGVVPLETIILRRQDQFSDPLPQETLASQDAQGVAISFTELGITANQIIFGYSIFGNDVNDTDHTLTDITTFPTDTDNVGGLDLIAGISTAVASDDNLIKVRGPGGYKSDLNTWLKANVGVTTATDGSDATCWQDQWLGDHDAVTFMNAPTFRDNVSDDINFNPTIDFIDANETGLQVANNTDFNTAASYERKSLNMAFRTGNDISTRQEIYEQGSNDRGLNIYIRNGSLYVGAWNETNDGVGSPWSFNSSSTSSIAVDTEYIVTIEFEGNSSETGSVTSYLNGQSFGTISNVGLLFADTDGIGLGDVNSQSRYDDGTTPASSFYGSIAEFVYCNENASFSFSQRNRIESYLAIKYGITLDQSTPINYVNSKNEVIFDATNLASIGGYLEYNNDIAGIGRDDESEFEQLSSQSENNGSLVLIDKNNSLGTDNTWLVWGHDGAGTTETDELTMPDTIDLRLRRVWRVAEEGEIGVVDVSVDITDLGLGTDPSDFGLLIAASNSAADFSDAAVTSGGSLRSFDGRTYVLFEDVSFTDGEYFTLGTDFMECSPGGVETNLMMWLEADSEVFNTGTTLATNGQSVRTWSDQSGNMADATDPSDLTTWESNQANFNPAVFSMVMLNRLKVPFPPPLTDLRFLWWETIKVPEGLRMHF